MAQPPLWKVRRSSARSSPAPWPCGAVSPAWCPRCWYSTTFTGPTRPRWSCCCTFFSWPIKCRSCSCAPFAPTAARRPGASRPPPKRTTLTVTPRSPFSLSISESGTLVDNLLTISDLPEELRQLVLRKSEGNPFFLEEVVRVLVDHGVVQRDESGLRWKAAVSYEEIEIPDNLQALLLARIDRLEKDTRRTLQLASVIGRSFYHRVLQAIVAAVSDLDQQLVTLQRVELIRELGRRPVE